MNKESTTLSKDQLLMSVNARLTQLCPRKTEVSKALVFFTEYGGWHKEKVCDIRCSTSSSHLRVHRIANSYENAAKDALKAIEEMIAEPEALVSV